MKTRPQADPRPVLAATDLSAHARSAAVRAARLARQSGAELTLLHALPTGTTVELRRWLGRDVEQQLRDDAHRQLQALADELRAAHAITVHTHLSDGPVLDEVPRHADAIDAGLVVVGARGEGFLRRMVLGSTAERLLRRSVRPVLIVRTLPHERYRRALLTVDFSPWSAEVLALARQVAPDARWVLFHAFEVPFEDKLRFAGVELPLIDKYRTQARAHATQELQALARAAGLASGQWDPCIVEGDASLRLVEQEQAQDCDLVVIGKHGQSAAEDLLLGSVTNHLLADGLADVLVATRARSA